MKIDTYTRFLLTVIAICLVYLCVNDFLRVPKVQADSPMHVMLVDGNDDAIAGGIGRQGNPLLVEVEKR
jgi:hypothetical protein